jgi:hypothetical protein
MDIKEVGFGDVDCINVVLYKEQWRMFVNTLMNLRGPKEAGNFLTSRMYY